MPSHFCRISPTLTYPLIHSRGWESLCDVLVTCQSMLIQEFYSNMHEFDYLVPIFVTRVQGTHIMVIPDIVSNVLQVPRVKHPDYPGCDHLKIVSKDELISPFYERPSEWGEHQFTPCMAFDKGPRFLNVVMIFILYPLSYYNSIIEPCARFLLSLLKHLTIDFPSHFILSIIDVNRDTVTHDKFIFPSTITRILCHFSVLFPYSTISTLCVPLTPLPLNGARCSFVRGGLDWQLLPLLQLHPPPLPLLLWEV